MTGIILAAGKSKRMGQPLPKVLLPLKGHPVLEYVLRTCQSARIGRILVVVGDRREQVQAACRSMTHLAGPPLEFVVQSEPKGTADAVLSCSDAIPAGEDVVVLSGDVPLVRVQTLVTLIERLRNQPADLTLLTAKVENPKGYGRIVRDQRGAIQAIVEERDATPVERQIKEMNVGLYAFRWDRLLPILKQVRSSPATGEYYLTEVIRLLAEHGGKIESVETSDAAEFMGINTEDELRQVEQELEACH
jgi:bifunctional UDP-N-acetylglucosamine pyrophosphorylase/glucosamine-1-phosphate N-acetyltransferase